MARDRIDDTSFQCKRRGSQVAKGRTTSALSKIPTFAGTDVAKIGHPEDFVLFGGALGAQGGRLVPAQRRTLQKSLVMPIGQVGGIHRPELRQNFFTK